MSVIDDSGESVDYDPFSGDDVLLAYPSTESQREIWVNSQIADEASCAYNESLTVHLEGKLDEALLSACLAAIAERHEALRSTFNEEGTVVTVVSSVKVPLTILPTGGKLEEYLALDSSTIFNLREGPLFRCALLKSTETRHELVISAHDIVCDDWSLGVILRDLCELYTAGIEGRQPVLGKDPGFSRYASRAAEQLSGERHRGDAEYWKKAFASLPPDLDLPTDRRRPALRTFSARRVEGSCAKETTEALRQVGSDNEASLDSVLLAAYTAFLYKLTGKTDIVVAIPIEGQPLADMNDLVGQCVNLLPIRSSLGPATTFGELVGVVQKSVSEAMEHSSYTYGDLVRDLRVSRDPSRMPIISTVFARTRRLPAGALKFGGLSASYTHNPKSSETFEINTNAIVGPDGLEFLLHFNSALFVGETMPRRVHELETLIADIILRPNAVIDDLNMLPGEERNLVMRKWNDTRKEYPEAELLHRIYAERVAAMPDAVAIRDSAGSLTHRDFKKRVDAGIAHLAGPDLRQQYISIFRMSASDIKDIPRQGRDQLSYFIF